MRKSFKQKVLENAQVQSPADIIDKIINTVAKELATVLNTDVSRLERDLATLERIDADGVIGMLHGRKYGEFDEGAIRAIITGDSTQTSEESGRGTMSGPDATSPEKSVNTVIDQNYLNESWKKLGYSERYMIVCESNLDALLALNESIDHNLVKKSPTLKRILSRG